MPEYYQGKGPGDASSEDNPEVVKRNEAYLAGFRKGEITQRDKENLVEVMDKLAELADSVEKVPSMNWDRMGSMFRSMGGAMSGMMGGMMGGIMGPSMGMMQSAMAPLGRGMGQIMAPTTVMIQKFMADITQPMADFTARYQTGAAIGGLVGMIGGAAAGAYMGGGASGAMVGGQILGTFGSTLGAAIEQAITGTTAEEASEWKMAIVRECQKYNLSSGGNAAAIAKKMLTMYYHTDAFWVALNDLLGTNYAQYDMGILTPFIQWIQATIINPNRRLPSETTTPGGRGPGRVPRKPPNRRLM